MQLIITVQLITLPLYVWEVRVPLLGQRLTSLTGFSCSLVPSKKFWDNTLKWAMALPHSYQFIIVIIVPFDDVSTRECFIK